MSPRPQVPSIVERSFPEANKIHDKKDGTYVWLLNDSLQAQTQIELKFTRKDNGREELEVTASERKWLEMFKFDVRNPKEPNLTELNALGHAALEDLPIERARIVAQFVLDKLTQAGGELTEAWARSEV